MENKSSYKVLIQVYMFFYPFLTYLKLNLPVHVSGEKFMILLWYWELNFGHWVYLTFSLFQVLRIPYLGQTHRAMDNSQHNNIYPKGLRLKVMVNHTTSLKVK